MFARLGAGESEEGSVVLLIGDTTHIHSPVSGQGLNLGLRDGIFFGEALPKHVSASETEPLSEADSILREFAIVRRARALEVTKFTKGMLMVTEMKYRKRMAW